MNKKKEKMAEGARQIPIIKGEVTRHLCKDFDGLLKGFVKFLKGD